MQMGYQRIVKRVETRTETTVEIRTFSPGFEQFTELVYCSAELLPTAQQEPEETEPMPTEQTIGLVLEDIDEDPIGPWPPDPRVDRALRKVRQERALQAQLDFLRESKKAWKQRYPSRFSRFLSSVGALLGTR